MRTMLSRHPGRWGLALLALVVLGLHLAAIGGTLVADDHYFSKVLEERSLPEYLAFRYERWTGRLAIEAVLALVVAHGLAWKLLNAAMLVLLCHATGRLALRGSGTVAEGVPALLAFALFLLMAPAVVYESAWWRTGAINYLWPAATGLYSLLALADRPGNTPLRRIACLLAGGFACQQEQFALVLVPVAAWLALAGRDERPGARAWDLAQCVFMLANAALLFSAPGSRNRYTAEIGTHFPDFGSLDVVDRAAIGVELVHAGMVDPANLLSVSAAALALVLLARSAHGPAAKAAMALPLGYVLLLPLAQWLLTDPQALRPWFAPPGMGGADASSLRTYAMHAWLATASVGLAIACSLALARTPPELLRYVAVFALGLGAVFVLGYSPTAYASGSRIHFVAQVVLLVATLRLLGAWRERLGARAWWLAVAAIALLALGRLAGLLGLG